jgi:hypothetical protein
MQEYYGIIDHISVSNRRISDEPLEEGSREFIALNEKCLNFVYYPDYQQISFRIPHFGRDYGMFRLYNNTGHTIP